MVEPERRPATGDTPTASTSASPDTSDPTRQNQNRKARAWRFFADQRVPGRYFTPDLRYAVTILAALTLAFLAGGITMLVLSLQQVDVSVVYSDAGVLGPLSPEARSRVMQGTPQEGVALPVQNSVAIPIDKDMDGPVYVYYVLTDFHQNHKRYVRSVDFDQLHGKTSNPSSPCDPQSRLQAPGAPNEGKINPCGLQAWSFFNDTISNFAVVEPDQPVESAQVLRELPVDGSDLVWDSDRGFLFANFTPVNVNTPLAQQQGGKELVVNVDENEPFMNWMRPYGKPDVHKYLGVIRDDLRAGEVVRVNINHQYNTYGWDGKKKIFLTTQNAYGGRNLTFGIAWLIGAAITGLATLAYGVLGGKQITSSHERRLWLQRRWEEGTHRT